MHPRTHDLIIHGAGPVGSALALLLSTSAPKPERIAVVGHFPDIVPSATGTPSRPDPRTLALNHGSQVMLEQVQAWPPVSAAIETVHVSQRGRLGRTMIRQDDFGVARLGSVVAYDNLLAAMHRRLAHTAIDCLQENESWIAVTAHAPAPGPERRIVRAPVVIRSHGHRPQGVHRTYDQHAVLATVRASHPRTAVAYERFTRDGPLALLPHPQGSGTYAVVWCCPPLQAARLKALSQHDFEQALTRTFGDRLGRLQCVGERHVFPLELHAGPQQLNDHELAIGNAAQTLHPVAGQGLNLGLRDAAQLVIALAPWLTRPAEDPHTILQDYVRRRRADRWLTAATTDLLPRIFSTGNPLVEHACGLALLGLDVLPPVRNRFARHLLQGLRL